MGPCPNVLYKHLCDDLLFLFPLETPESMLNLHTKDVWPDITSDQYAAICLLKSVLKKYTPKGTNKLADAAALELFHKVNGMARDWSIDYEHLSEIDSLLLGQFEKYLNDTLNPTADEEFFMSLDNILQNIDIGPGASRQASGTSFYHKIANGPMSATSESLYAKYKWHTEACQLEDETEQNRSTFWGDCVVIKGGKLGFAEKNREISRVIVTEPLLNMMFQKGIAACMEGRLERLFGINLTDQPTYNKQLAWLGSWTGIFGTADSTSASDLIAVKMLDCFLKQPALGVLKKYRSPFAELPNKEWVELHMISTMGNGFNFPLQTIIYACALKSAYKIHGLSLMRSSKQELGNFGVFGDDIVCHKSAYDSLLRLLELLGFIVNKNKSFNDGPFRESCGGDYVSGRNVRGVYAKHLDSPQDVYKLYNRLSFWSADQDIRLSKSLSYLLSCAWVLPVPPYENDDTGFKMPLRSAIRFFYPNQVKELSSIIRDHNGSYLYLRYVPRPLNQDFREVRELFTYKVITTRKEKLKKKCPHNHAGILLAAVCSRLRGGFLTLRTESTRYFRQVAIAPGWDWIDERVFPNGRHARDRWLISSVDNGLVTTSEVLAKS